MFFLLKTNFFSIFTAEKRGERLGLGEGRLVSLDYFVLRNGAKRESGAKPGVETPALWAPPLEWGRAKRRGSEARCGNPRPLGTPLKGGGAKRRGSEARCGNPRPLGTPLKGGGAKRQ